jgi:hypothetical protein
MGLATARVAAELGASVTVVSARAGCVERALAEPPDGTPGRVPTSLWAGSDEATREGLFKKAAAASLVKRVGDVDELTVDGVDLGCPRGHRLRPPRPERRREDEHRNMTLFLVAPAAGAAHVGAPLEPLR